MKSFTALLATIMTLTVAHAADQRSFTTEADVKWDGTAGQYLITTRVSELIAREAETVEKLIAAPRITVVAGKPASITDGPTDGTQVRADVFWPESGSDKPASIVITLKSEGKVLTRTKFKLDSKSTTLALAREGAGKTTQPTRVEITPKSGSPSPAR
jgi:hypothetical protein